MILGVIPSLDKSWARVGLAYGAPSYADQSAVDALVRDAIRQALGSTGEPLAGFVRPGDTVLLKPNWVLDRNLGGGGMDCVVTHSAVIEATITTLRAARPARIILGDAPVQGCRLDNLVTSALRARLTQAAGDIPLLFEDFRNSRPPPHRSSGPNDHFAYEHERYTLFDLRTESLLEPVSSPAGRFRVTMYDPDALLHSHGPGCHRYLISRVPFEADVVINLPKLKTHRKAGVTAALKNLVGINGNKDFLPHHRAGSPHDDGDCYAENSRSKRLSERLLDGANRRIGDPTYRYWKRASTFALNAHAVLELGRELASGTLPPRRADVAARRAMLLELEGGWSGNDTVWRTCLDLNRVLLFGNADGTMRETPRARVLHVCDAIIAGQGEGPLAPEPFPLGVITCSASAAAADLVHCELLGFDWRRIPLAREAFSQFRWPLAGSADDVRLIVAGQELEPRSALVRKHAGAKPPAGWSDVIRAAAD